MYVRSINALALLFVFVSFAIFAAAQTPTASHWAADNDPVAKMMTDNERKWATAGCDHSISVADFIADDFQGTAPNGSRYDKAAAIKRETEQTERDCKLDGVKVHFFGDSVAMAYGSERATHKNKDGEKLVCLAWTDTWLKRNGKWQIVAAHDAVVDCK